MNKRDTDLLDMLPALEDGSLMYTPISICRDMVNLIPDDVFNKDAKFLDIACKSGRFLREIMYRLMESKQMQSGSAEGRDAKKYNLAIESERKEYIMREQLFGLSLNDTVVNIARRNLYGTLDSGIDNIIVLKENIRKTLKEKFGDMQFDVVVGNPPYNNDLHLDFVTFGHNLARKYDCWITPAKWQAKGGDKNKQFREDIVPYMSKIIYYPCSTEIFDIAEVDGISIFLSGHAMNDNKEIINRSNKITGFNNKAFRQVGNTLNNVTYNIVQKMAGIQSLVPFEFKSSVSHWGIAAGEEYGDFGKGINIVSGGKVIAECSLHDISKNIQDVEKINVVINRMAGYCYFFDNDGRTVGINKLYILGKNYIAPFNYSCLCSFETFDEAKSFVSFMYSRIVRFICVTTLVGTNLANNEAWRCIRVPEAFDHIFTDQELYEKYQLTDEEISIIESVIKERK